MVYDVAIIGAGVSGCGIAMELSKYDLSVIILEKGMDVALGATKANSGIVHSGYDCQPGTLMAKLNVEGSKMMAKLCEDLKVPYENTGSLVIGFDDEDKEKLQELYEKGIANGVEAMEIVGGDRAREIEKSLSKDVKWALYAKTASIVSPYELAIGMCENAVENGAKLIFDFEVVKIEKHENFIISSPSETIEAKYIVNAAGIYADKISKMAGAEDFEILPRKGEYMLFDKNIPNKVSTVIFQTPSKMGKGVLTAPTVHGNMFIGPNAQDMDDKEDKSTTMDGLNYIKELAQRSVESIHFPSVITQFSGMRAVYGGKKDFYIKNSELQPHFVQIAGICSPGLSASPAIAAMAAELLKEAGLQMNKKKVYKSTRDLPKPFSAMTEEEIDQAYKNDKRYGRIICRCETVTEAEIVAAIHSKVPALTVDSIKRRTRSTGGRCQGGFCGPRILEILCRELGKEPNEIVKVDKDAYIVASRLREGK
ncbi:MAG: NAD(P)/FAD-dependent oxidoreductase [Eubacteriales bacterium]